MLDFDLTENLLTTAPDDFMAQVTNVLSHDEEEIVARMLKKGAGLTRSDILSVRDMYTETVCEIIAEGGAVVTPLFNAFPSIPGVFKGIDDPFDPKRHSVKINLTSGKSTREAVKLIKVHRVHVANPLPLIVAVKDTLSGSTNDTITPGGVIQVLGSRLKVVEENVLNGVFLTDEYGTETKLPVIVENKPARIIVMLPVTLATGNYSLEVRTTFREGKDGKEAKTLRVGRLLKELHA
jgi:hypothetical protein